MGPACIRGYTASLLPVNVFQVALRIVIIIIIIKNIFLFGHPRAT